VPLTLYHHYGAIFSRTIGAPPRGSRSISDCDGRRDRNRESHGQVTSFDTHAPVRSPERWPIPPTRAVLALRGSYRNLPGLLTFPQGPQSATHWRRFAPRIGAAFRLNKKTSLRGGYALFYVPLSVEQGTAIGNVFTTSVSQSSNTVQ